MKSLLFTLFLTSTIVAQNTISFTDDTVAENATLSAVAWMEGHWVGEAFGGKTEEIWGPPLGGSMMFVFKHVAEGEVTFYEVGHFREIDNTLIYELKHFDKELKGWETKDEVQQFKYLKKEGNRTYFDGFTFENVSKNEVIIYALIGEDAGAKEVTFNFKRYGN